jgi:AcrR family transcriptional regulator
MVTSAPRRTPREVRHDDNERRILDAALALVSDVGFDGLSMSRLASSVGFTPGALYRYFDSKDVLLAKIIESALAAVRATLTHALARLPEGACPLSRVFAIAFSYREFARERPNEFGLLAMSMAAPRIVLQDPKEGAAVAGRMMLTFSPLSDAFEDAQATGRLTKGDVPERTLCLFAIVQGTLQLHKQARFAEALLDLDRLTEKGVSALLAGWGASPAAIAGAVSAARGTRQTTTAARHGGSK